MVFVFQEFVKRQASRHIFFVKTGFVFPIAAATVPKSKSTRWYKLLRICATCYLVAQDTASLRVPCFCKILKNIFAPEYYPKNWIVPFV